MCMGTGCLLPKQKRSWASPQSFPGTTVTPCQNYSSDPSPLPFLPKHLLISLQRLFITTDLPTLPPLGVFLGSQHLQVHIMFHEAHPSIPGPALLVVVAYDVLIVGIWMLCQVSLNQVSCLICCKPGNAQKRVWSYQPTPQNTSLTREIRTGLWAGVCHSIFEGNPPKSAPSHKGGASVSLAQSNPRLFGLSFRIQTENFMSTGWEARNRKSVITELFDIAAFLPVQ